MPQTHDTTDDWSKNWQAKIAVRITSIVLWSLSFVSMIIASILISQVKEKTEHQATLLLDHLSFLVIQQISNDEDNLDKLFKTASSQVLKNENFNQVTIRYKNKRYTYGQKKESDTLITRNPIKSLDLTITASTIPINVSVRNEQIEIFMIFSVSLIALGAFLALIIDKYVRRPFQILESATQEFTSGNKQSRVDLKTKDEFGVLAKFLNQMLDRINENELSLNIEMQQRRSISQKIREQRDDLQLLTNKLTIARDQAFAASHAKSAFLANMSHELRTPLNAVIGYSELLIEEAMDCGNTDQLNDLKKIRSAGKHLLILINDVLDISKIEAGKMELLLEVFDLSPLIEETISLIQPLIKQHNNQFSYQINDPHITMCADTTRIKQILFNLLSNASKFSPNANVRLEVEVYATDMILFKVIDTGVGIDPKQIESIFNEFEQADDSTTREFGGTGLGLAICRQLCRLMGGDIVVNSEPGKGSTFIASLPLHCELSPYTSPEKKS